MGPRFVRFSNYSRQMSSGAWWMVMAPGLLLVVMAVAILVWPELLAYMVASVILFVGLTLAGWGWTLRQTERRKLNQQSNHVYKRSERPETVIYYER